jgi:predicted thioredoxin/glutaredoxin
MSDKKTDNKALEELVREAAKALGPVDPAQLPHRIKQRLAGQIDGSVDVDSYIHKLMQEMRDRDNL